MLMDRIIAAFTFKQGIYSAVAQDEEFTDSAWIIVAVSTFLSQLGGQAAMARSGGFFRYVIAVLIGTLVGLFGFALTAWVTAFVARSFFKSEADFWQMQRGLGLASVWRVVGLIGILGGFSLALACVSAPVSILAGIVGLVAYLFAIREITKLEWGPAIVTVIVAAILAALIGAIAGGILGIFGLGAAALTGGLN